MYNLEFGAYMNYIKLLQFNAIKINEWLFFFVLFCATFYCCLK